MTYESGPSLNHTQKQIVYGTILGGSSLFKPKAGINYHLVMRDQDYEWIMYKVEELSDFYKMDENVIKKDKNTYRCHSIAYPALGRIYRKFFDEDGRRVILKETIESLTDIAWMVWFVDAGRKDDDNVYLRTNSFGQEGTKTIVEYFNSLDCSCEKVKSRGGYDIMFDNKGSYKFLNTIVHRMPKFIINRYD